VGQDFRHLGDEVRFVGWRISLVEATFEAPDGTRYTRDVVRHPGAVAVVAATERDTVLLVRQYRGAVDRKLLELPAGTRDVEGEPPETTARRELEEEVGVRAGRLRFLGTTLNSPGFCDEESHIYLAQDLEPVPPARHGEEERYLEVVEVALADVDSLLASQEIVDAQTVIGLLLARDMLHRST
jgi:ADP-ribose pyrophosphatase